MREYPKTKFNNHSVFAIIEKFQSFHDFISYSTIGSKTNGISGFFNIDYYIASFLSLTLESISSILQIGNISDAYSLMRKYEDLTLISIYFNLKIESEFKLLEIEDLPWTIDSVNDWVENIMEYKMALYEKIDNYIKTSFLKDFLLLLDTKVNYQDLRKSTGNRYTHFNMFRTLLPLTYNHSKNADKALNQFEFVITQFFIKYFALLTQVSEDQFRSSDYVDYLDAGLQPPEEALNWVSPIANDLLNDVVYKNRPDVAKYIIDNSQMHWELNKEIKL